MINATEKPNISPCQVQGAYARGWITTNREDFKARSTSQHLTLLSNGFNLEATFNVEKNAVIPLCIENLTAA